MNALQLLGCIDAVFAVQFLFIEIDNLRRGPSRVSATNESPGLSATDRARKTVAAGKVKVSAKRDFRRAAQILANYIILPDSANVIFLLLFKRPPARFVLFAQAGKKPANRR